MQKRSPAPLTRKPLTLSLSKGVTPGLTRGPAFLWQNLSDHGRDFLACIITVPAALIVWIAVLMILAEVVKATAP